MNNKYLHSETSMPPAKWLIQPKTVEMSACVEYGMCANVRAGFKWTIGLKPTGSVYEYLLMYQHRIQY